MLIWQLHSVNSILLTILRIISYESTAGDPDADGTLAEDMKIMSLHWRIMHRISVMDSEDLLSGYVEIDKIKRDCRYPVQFHMHSTTSLPVQDQRISSLVLDSPIDRTCASGYASIVLIMHDFGTGK